MAIFLGWRVEPRDQLLGSVSRERIWGWRAPVELSVDQALPVQPSQVAVDRHAIGSLAKPYAVSASSSRVLARIAATYSEQILATPGLSDRRTLG